MRKQLRLVLVAVCAMLLLGSAAAQRYEWRDVRQHVRIEPDGTVRVHDERTLWTNEDFGEAFLCVNLRGRQRLRLLDDSGAVDSSTPARALVQRCDLGTELVVRFDQRVQEERVRFSYELTGTVNAHADVVQWYWNILEREHPPVHGYRLVVEVPGPMDEPFDAFVHRYDNTEEPRVSLSADRSRLEVEFDRIPDGDGVEIRYLMDPELFTISGRDERFLQFLEEEAELAGIAERPGLWQQLRWLIEMTLRRHWLSALAAFGSVLFVLGSAVVSGRAARRAAPPGETMLYPFEPPSDLPPAAAAALAVKRPGQIASRNNAAQFATIMDLARRGYGSFDTRGRRFRMQLDLDRDPSGLHDFERTTLQFLQQAAASSGDPTVLDDRKLKRYSANRYRPFMATWRKQRNSWLEERFGGPLVSDSSRRASNNTSFIGVAFLILFFAVLFLGGEQQGRNLLLFFTIPVLAVALAVAANFIPWWRRDVVDEAQRWQGFRRTLSDYTRMKDAPDDFFLLWDRYYCYAAAFGVAERYLRNVGRAVEQRNLDQQRLLRRGVWLGSGALSGQGNFSQLNSQIGGLSRSLSAAGVSASSGGSSRGGGGGGGGGRSGGR